jgi:hypothetical protein
MYQVKFEHFEEYGSFTVQVVDFVAAEGHQRQQTQRETSHSDVLIFWDVMLHQLVKEPVT